MTHLPFLFLHIDVNSVCVCIMQSAHSKHQAVGLFMRSVSYSVACCELCCVIIKTARCVAGLRPLAPFVFVCYPAPHLCSISWSPPVYLSPCLPLTACCFICYSPMSLTRSLLSSDLLGWRSFFKFLTGCSLFLLPVVFFGLQCLFTFFFTRRSLHLTFSFIDALCSLFCLSPFQYILIHYVTLKSSSRVKTFRAFCELGFNIHFLREQTLQRQDYQLSICSLISFCTTETLQHAWGQMFCVCSVTLTWNISLHDWSIGLPV